MRTLEHIWLAALLLACVGCGSDSTGTFPRDQGSLADYASLTAGSTYVYRLDGDPNQTDTMTVKNFGDGLLECELLPSNDQTPRIALYLRPGTEQYELVRLEQGAVRIDYDPAIVVLSGPLREGITYSGSTRLHFLGSQFGVNLLGLTDGFKDTTVVQHDYQSAANVTITVQIDLLGKSKIELVLARDVGPVEVKVISPAIEMLGLSGLEMHLELPGKS